MKEDLRHDPGHAEHSSHCAGAGGYRIAGMPSRGAWGRLTAQPPFARALDRTTRWKLDDDRVRGIRDGARRIRHDEDWHPAPFVRRMVDIARGWHRDRVPG